MRIPSGNTTTRIPFVAVDEEDFVTRLTGLDTFTVLYSRNGGTLTTMTSPTITEDDDTDAPGEYWLLLDEGTTLDSGFDNQALKLTIKHAGMATATLVVEIYRPKITLGRTLNVAEDGDIGGNVDGAVASVTGNVGGNVAGSVGSLAAQAKADVKAEAAAALADYDPPTNAELEARTLPAADYATADGLGAVANKVDGVTQAIGEPVESLAEDIAAVKADTAGIIEEIGEAGAGLTEAGGTGDHLTALASASALSTLDGKVDGIKGKTDNLPADPASDTTISGAASTILGAIGGLSFSTLTAQQVWEYGTRTLTSGGDGGSAPSAEEVAAAVWEHTDRTLTEIDEGSTTLTMGATIRGALGMVSDDLADQLSALKSDTAAILLDTGTDGVVVADASKSGYSLSNDGIDAVLTRPLVESYSTKGGAVTLAQALYELLARDQEVSISGTTMTLRKRDGSTVALTFTLDDAGSPSSVSRAA